MIRTRLAAAGVAAALVFGGGAAAYSQAIDPLAATATPTGWTVTIPGAGVVTFAVDATGAVTNLVLVPAPDATQATLPSDGVHVSYTAADGTTRVFVAEVEHENGVLRVKAEDAVDEHGTSGDGEHKGDDSAGVEDQNNGSQADGQSGPNDEQQGEHGDGQGASPSTPSTTPSGSSDASQTKAAKRQNRQGESAGQRSGRSGSGSKATGGGESKDGGSSHGESSGGGSSSGGDNQNGGSD